MLGLGETWSRYRTIARAYDGARALAEHVPPDADVLDLGCGRGFVAYHLGALGRSVIGVDLDASAEAPIRYVQFDGARLPFEDERFDAVLLSFVLHHAPNIAGLLVEARRVLRASGRILVFEDIPERWHDRLLCQFHDYRWRSRTGPCTFLGVRTWGDLFESLGFRVTLGRALPRLRNPLHPVLGQLFVLERR